MGSANITPVQGQEIVQAMKQEYENYYHTSSSTNTLNPNPNDEEFRELILQKYQMMLMNINGKNQENHNDTSEQCDVNNNQKSDSDENQAMKPISETSSNISTTIQTKRNLSKNTNGSKSMEARPKVTSRLRSFDEAPKPKKQKDKTPLDTRQEMDSWDSVKGQPACLLCAMVFATPEKLATHTKYSTIHASNLKKLENSKFAGVTKSVTPSKSVRVSSNDATASYRVLYTGSKFFWRSKHHIDFHIYQHTSPSVLEIIGYDSATQTELPRLYLDENIVSNSISREDINSRLQQNKVSNTKYLSVLENPTNLPKNPSKIKTQDTQDETFTSITEDRADHTTDQLDALLYEEEKRVVIVSRLMSKLQYQRVSTSIKESLLSARTGNLSLDQYELCFIDPQLQSAIMAEKPQNITPVVIPRRRHSTQAEITESFRSLNTMQMELHEITTKAEKMSHLIRASIELFTQHHFSPPKPSQYSSPRTKSQRPFDKQTAEILKKKEIRERWRYAIHKVVLRNALGQTVEMLKQKGVSEAVR